MQKFYIEGIFLSRRGVQKAKKSGRYTNADLEPFARAFWAENADDAMRQATEALEGGQWVEGPRLGKKSEEERMRALGAPELPGFGAPKRDKAKKKGK
jgi:hypothetical protein